MRLAERFRQLYGQTPRLFRAPGRVNLIGEHTDYNEGFVLPVALDFSTWVAVAPRTDGHLVVRSMQFDEEVRFAVEDCSRDGHHWSDYVRGVALSLPTRQAATLLIGGEVPIGAGLSSSAALQVASALALLATAGIQLLPAAVARLCQRAENEFVGMRCGIMDQFICCCAQAGHALLIDCRSLKARAVPLGESTRLIMVNSMIRHALAGGEYNRRRQQCEEGARHLGVQALRDASLEDLERLPADLKRRCHHVLTENARTTQAAEALQAGDLEQLGRLMAASHASLRDDYQVSCPELDRLVELAGQVKGCYGARMTGGGFGGCTVNLVRADRVEAFVAHIRQGYRPEPEIYVCQASQGAEEVRLPGTP